MDVYVPTSMREQEEFIEVYDFQQGVFCNETLRKLNLRHFDPTQAYTENRIDKGIIEALMIKRAKLTLYCAQEADTFGKDSELAATLAQGKPVVVYVR